MILFNLFLYGFLVTPTVYITFLSRNVMHNEEVIAPLKEAGEFANAKRKVGHWVGLKTTRRDTLPLVHDGEQALKRGVKS